MKNSTSNKLDDKQKTLWQLFTKGSWLANENNYNHFIEWNTFYRKNPHRFVNDYLGIKLHLYQIVIIYLMFHSDFIVIIACRAAAKSFIIAVYAVTKAILYPNSQIILTSGTRGQSRLIVSEKIEKELWNKSPNLRREIVDIKTQQNEVKVTFKCGSTIETVTCNDNALGHRSTVNVGEEAKTIKKSILDRVISPFRIIRQVDFIKLPEYADNPIFKEEPVEILISSSIEEGHWLYKQAVVAKDGMFKESGSFFVALDYSITLKHNIRTRKQMINTKKTTDALTWAIEYENAVLRANTKAYFSYDILKQCQTMLRAFYPRKHEDVLVGKKNKYALPKLDNEVRAVCCDIAAVDRGSNDNSIFACLRIFPPDKRDGAAGACKVQVPYLESHRGREIRKQALRIRQLFEDFNADFIVLDTRNVGISVYDSLARVLFDDDRCVEYAPLKCMNDDTIAKRINSVGAKECIFAINASLKLNSDIAVNLRSMLIEREVELLVNIDEGMETIIKQVPDYNAIREPEDKLFYDRPYLETMALISETTRLQYEKGENTGYIKIREQGVETKDRYTAVSYGCYFAVQWARDAFEDEQEELLTPAICVSAL